MSCLCGCLGNQPTLTLPRRDDFRDAGGRAQRGLFLVKYRAFYVGQPADGRQYGCYFSRAAFGGQRMTTTSSKVEWPQPSPTPCARCGGVAKLLRVTPDAFTRGRFEFHVYECIKCSARIEHIVTKKE